MELSVLGHVEGGIHKAQEILDGRRKKEEGETKMEWTRMEAEGEEYGRDDGEWGGERIKEEREEGGGGDKQIRKMEQCSKN